MRAAQLILLFADPSLLGVVQRDSALFSPRTREGAKTLAVRKGQF
jgi:hypothetical protein